MIIILLTAGIIGCGLILILQRDGAYVSVSVDGVNQGIYSLAKDRELTIETQDGGINVLKIQDGVVDMVSANCPNKDCVQHASISRHNESIICLPHRLVVMIYDETSAGETDATVY